MKLWQAALILLLAALAPGFGTYYYMRASSAEEIDPLSLPPRTMAPAENAGAFNEEEGRSGGERHDWSSTERNPGDPSTERQEGRGERGERGTAGDRERNGQPGAERPDERRRQPDGNAITAERPGGERPPRNNGGNRPATFELTRLVGDIGRLEEGRQNTLTPAQAKAIVAVLKPLQTQATLTPQQAQTVLTRVKGQLTAAQLTAIENLPNERRGPQGGNGEGRPGGDRPAGNRLPPGEGMENMNPFNPNADNPMAARMAERLGEVIAVLEAKAAQ